MMRITLAGKIDSGLGFSSGWASRGGPCQHLHPSSELEAEEPVQEEVREVDQRV